VNTTPHQQQLQRQQQQLQKKPKDLSSKGGKQGYQPSISEQADATGSKSRQSGSAKHNTPHGTEESSGLPQKRHVSMELFKPTF